MGDIGEDVRRVRQAFERLKPELAKKEKRLREGDEINPDRLLDYLVTRRQEPSPRRCRCCRSGAWYR